MIKLTQKHFDVFRKTCREYLDKLGLQGWRVEYHFKPLKENRGQCHANSKGRVACFVLSSAFGNEYLTDKPIEEFVIETAKHECLELLLWDLGCLADSRGWIEDQWGKELHTVIRTLEKII